MHERGGTRDGPLERYIMNASTVSTRGKYKRHEGSQSIIGCFVSCRTVTIVSTFEV